MTALVVDCSVAVSWCFEDEASPEMDAILDRVRAEGAIVPGIWHLEIGNVLLGAQRRGRIVSGSVADRLQLLSELAISVDYQTMALAWDAIFTLAQAEGLTTYDAAYLELAIRRKIPLATKDRALSRAARRTGVSALP